MLADHRGVGADVEYAAHPLDDAEQCPRLGEADLQAEGQPGLQVGNGDRSVPPLEGDGPPVAPRLDRLDPNGGARSQEAEDGLPVIGRAIGETEPVALGVGHRLGMGAPPELGRSARVGAPHLAVEAADAAEARRERDPMNGERRLVEQPLGEVHATSEGHVDGRRAEMLQEEAAQMAGSDAQAVRQPLHPALVERPVADEAEGAGHETGGAEPGRRPRGRFGPAAQTGTVSGRTRRGRGRKVAHVLVLRCSRRADRPAVHTGARDPDEEAAVEPRVSRPSGPVAGAVIQFHASRA